LTLEAVLINSDEGKELLEEGLVVLVNMSIRLALSLVGFSFECLPQGLQEQDGEIDVKHHESGQGKQLVSLWLRSERLRCQFCG